MQRISHAAKECLRLLYLACSHLSWACFCTPKVLNCSYSTPRSAQMRAAARLCWEMNQNPDDDSQEDLNLKKNF
jgi:hypothetical protein